MQRNFNSLEFYETRGSLTNLINGTLSPVTLYRYAHRA